MEAGRELNVKVAERLGYSRAKDGWWDHPDDSKLSFHESRTPRWADRIAIAWELVEEINLFREHRLQQVSFHIEAKEVWLWVVVNLEREEWMSDPCATAPLAICLAFLKATER